MQVQGRSVQESGLGFLESRIESNVGFSIINNPRPPWEFRADESRNKGPENWGSELKLWSLSSLGIGKGIKVAFF